MVVLMENVVKSRLGNLLSPRVFASPGQHTVLTIHNLDGGPSPSHQKAHIVPSKNPSVL